MIQHSRIGQSGLAAVVVLAALAPRAAHAEVRREGQWPANDPVVSLDFDGVPRGEALNRLAKAAGWSIVVTAPKGDPVNLHVEKQPADKVLDLLLLDGRYVARREQSLIAIAPAALPGDPSPMPEPPPVPPVPPVPPALPAALPIPPAPPAPPAAVDDDDDDRNRVVTGGSLRIEKGEVVHDVTVFGGNLDVWGTVTGDLAVFGGNVRIHGGGHVHGDVSVVGGAIDVASGASVDGDVAVLGGELHRADGATIGGDINAGMRKHKAGSKAKAREVREHARDDVRAKAGTSTASVRALARSAADAVNGAALLFVFGAVLLALAPARMEQLELQIASRPMRTFATGVVSLLGGMILLAAVCVTIIGIPIAAVAVIAAIIGTLAGVCAVLETVGAALLAHRTKNPYVHLAFGGLLFLIAGAIPFVGTLVKLAVFLTALGSVAATRAAGLLPTRLRDAGSNRESMRS